MSSNFCHLHCHSEYSLLDGMGRTDILAREAARLGQPALALTDHGVLHGAVEFFRNAKKYELKPIIGIEAYLTPFGRSMTDKDPNKDKVRHHLLLLAMNMTGYKNLLKIASSSQLEGYYYKPRIDADFLAAHADGLICTSGCMAAEIPWLLNAGEGRPSQPEKALERLKWYLDVFGRDRFFIELQEHNIPTLTEINKTLFAWGKQYGLEFLVTNDVHYVTARDAQAHDTLLCVQTNSLITDKSRLQFSDHGYYLKSEEEMRRLFQPLTELPDNAFTNTVKIAEMCDVDLEDNKFHLPDPFENPGEKENFNRKTSIYDLLPREQVDKRDYEAALRYLTDQGLIERYGQDGAASELVQNRKEHELGIINGMGFAIYYLLVWDLCQYAREQNIWWNVRGSGAGSIVAYALGITLIDPLRHNLIFERFLNPGRISMPDFDLDYPDDQREYMIEYTRRRYGDKRVAQIVSFGRMKARAAIRDVGRAMDIPLNEVDTIAKYIAAIPGKPATIENALDAEHEFFSPELKERYENESQIQQLVDFAHNLEGVARHASVHAAAVIITDKDLTDYVPVMRAQGSVITESVTQFEFPVCESIGLLKVDFLGLSTLTVMRKAAELIKARHNLDFNLSNIPMDDPKAFENFPEFPPPDKAFELLARGDVTGVFQVEGTGMRRVLTEMKPTKFDHIVAAISLYRPGPLEYIPTYIARMHGEENVEFKHPNLEPILAETYGIIVYQEQIIQIASELAGYAPGDADRIRKAVGKKKKKEIDAHRSKFIAGAVDNGIPKRTAAAIYSDIEFFARYGFNKAHAADYALVTCQTAYLKANFPIEYMAALLTVERGNTEKIGMLVGECRAMGLEVLPPAVNHSGIEFTIEDRPGRDPGIRFSLAAIKNVGEGPVQEIMNARADGGSFSGVDEFCNRVDLRRVGRKALEMLIRVGALDDFAERHVLLAITDRMVNLSSSTHKASSVGQMSMFDFGGFDAPQLGTVLRPIPEDAESIPQKERLAWEKELAGTYLSSHPMQKYIDQIAAAGTTPLAAVAEGMHGQVVTVAGMINFVRPHQTKKGAAMAFVEIEDLQASREVLVFPKLYSTTKNLLKNGSLIVVRGRVDAPEGRQPKVLADTISNEIVVYSAAKNDTAQPESPPLAGEMPLFAEPEKTGETEPRPVATAPPTPPEPAAPQHTPASGYRDGGNGHHVAVAAPAAEADEGATPTDLKPEEYHQLHITLPLTGNLTDDKHRLKTVFDVLTETPGRDVFSIYISARNQSPVRIDFPNHSTHYTARLQQKLALILGAKSIRIEEPA